MNLRISRPAAWAAAFASAAARIFYALSVEVPIHSGAWLSPLLGAVGVIPLLMALDGLRGRAGHPLTLFFALTALTDSGLVLSAIVRSSSFLALEHLPTPCLALPVALAALWGICRNGNAVGFSAMLWARVFPALLLIVVLLEARHYRPRWLLPVLGNGWGSITTGGVNTAGCFVPSASLLLLCDDDHEPSGRKGPHAAALAWAGAVASILLVLRLMMAPVMLRGDSWVNRLDALLTNGRAPLYLQLPMIVAWYAGLLHLLTCECFAASALLQRQIPALDGRICAALATAFAALIALSPLSVSLSGLTQWLYIPAALLTALNAVTACGRKGGERACA